MNLNSESILPHLNSGRNDNPNDVQDFPFVTSVNDPGIYIIVITKQLKALKY